MHVLDEQFLYLYARLASYMFAGFDFTSLEAMSILAAFISLPGQLWHSSFSGEENHDFAES